MIIQHNISALNSYNKLANNNSSVSKNLSKLSSGYRINSAADDAAGLAISEKMRSQITGLDRAKLNAQDGISLVQTAEGALTEVHSMLNRLVELGTESANGTIQASDRQKIQDEVEALTEEIDRIAESTNFNGIKLLDGSLSGGANGTAGGLTGATIVNYKAAETTKAFANGSSVTFNDETYIINGTEVTVEWSKLSADDQALLKTNWTTASSSTKEEAAKLMQDTINAAITAAGGTHGVKVNVDGTAGFQIKSELTGTTNSVIKNAATSATTTNVGAFLLGVPTVGAPLTAAESLGVNIADANGKFQIVLDGEEFEIDLSGAGLTSASTSGDIVTQIQNALDSALDNYDTAKGLTGDKGMGPTATGSAAKIQVKMNNEGQLEFVNNSDKKMEFRDYEGKEYAKTLGISGAGKAKENGLTLQVGDTADDFNKVTVSVDDMSSKGLGLSGLRVTDQGLSSDSIEKVNKAIEKVSVNRGKLGALQNRLEHTINNLSTTSENMTSAESRIRDTDMAKEMMNFTKNNVLVQAAQSMLAQANQQPQQVLQLLR